MKKKTLMARNYTVFKQLILENFFHATNFIFAHFFKQQQSYHLMVPQSQNNEDILFWVRQY